ncbi:MAG: branched-chain amino acid ABC transporter permease [Gammaproteobacteria bacterium]|nr:branched-chain amino acid ABC transporter permease [Gammaproteobacteria bacterium]
MYEIELMINGLLVGSLYSIVALGFVLIYKASDVINFAQGQFVMFAGYVIAFWLLSMNMHLALAAVLALVIMVAVGLFIEWAVLRHLIGRPVVAIIMATIGLAFFLEGFAQMLFGIETRSVPLPISDEPIFVGDILINKIELIACGVAGVGFAAVGWFFIKSRSGIALRAIADDQQVSLAMGINVRRYFGIAWAIAGVVALIGGVFWGNATGVDTQLALIGLKVFPVVILGGLDSIIGAIVAGLIIGLLESLAAGYLDPLVGGGTKDLTPYVVMILVLMFKPYGLFGKPIIERV